MNVIKKPQIHISFLRYSLLTIIVYISVGNIQCFQHRVNFRKTTTVFVLKLSYLENGKFLREIFVHEGTEELFNNMSKKL